MTARSYSGPLSELAQSATWFVTPFSETAALNRSVVPTSQFDHEPAVAQAHHAEPVGVGQAERDDVIDGRMDVGGIDPAPVAELRADPVRGRTWPNPGCSAG